MSKTRKMTLFYNLTPTKIYPPPQPEVERKDDWIKDIQKTIEAEHKPQTIKVTYELYNPEVDNQRSFFNGPVIEYYIIQNEDMINGRPTQEKRKAYRETLLSDMLGYDIELVGRTERRRKSTGDFQDTQKWHVFLETLRETYFEPNGYEFPNSEDFWDLEKVYGYDKATLISINKLQEKIAKKLSTD